ncbi:MAG TPA: CHASE2 domain-containing protein [Rhizomicrobium sp.]|nr:CHASE2 domain-containing protein [Rhizomicrobium sp.]
MSKGALPKKPPGEASRWYHEFLRHDVGYWITAAVILAVSTWLGPSIEGIFNFNGVRNWLFQHLAQSVTNPDVARSVKLVFINDDEFWFGSLHHRTPTDRVYLSKVVSALDQAGARIIALDFDLRVPDPDANVTPGDYQDIDPYKPYRDETDQLVRVIDNVAKRRKIVLVKTFGYGDDGGYRFEGDAFQAYGICNGLNRDGSWKNPGTKEFPLTPQAQKNIFCGYIALMSDKRLVPPPIKISGEKGKLDSFPFAIVRANDPAHPPSLQNRDYYSTYITDKVADNPNVTLSAGDLIRDPRTASKVVKGAPVIIGAGWHLHSYGRGLLVDIHDTPIGAINGSLIHENMAEALMSNRIYPALPAPYLGGLEIAAGMLAALVFAGIVALWARILAVIVAILVLFGVQWLTLQLFGTFLDAFVPVFALGLHAIAGVVSEAGGGEGKGSTAADAKAARLAWVRFLRYPYKPERGRAPEEAEEPIDSVAAED